MGLSPKAWSLPDRTQPPRSHSPLPELCRLLMVPQKMAILPNPRRSVKFVWFSDLIIFLFIEMKTSLNSYIEGLMIRLPFFTFRSTSLYPMWLGEVPSALEWMGEQRADMSPQKVIVFHFFQSVKSNVDDLILINKNNSTLGIWYVKDGDGVTNF